MIDKSVGVLKRQDYVDNGKQRMVLLYKSQSCFEINSATILQVNQSYWILFDNLTLLLGNYMLSGIIWIIFML